MNLFEGGYPPNPRGMSDEKYKQGVDLLQTLLAVPDKDDVEGTLPHIEKVLNYTGVDSALYLLYYGHQVREVMTMGMFTEEQMARAFKTLLQTAVSIGAYISKHELNTINKLDKLWGSDIQEEVND